MTELNSTFLNRHGKYFSLQQIKKNPLPAFKDHQHIPILLDILSRKNTHHVLLQHTFSPKIHLPFLEALLMSLSHDHVPHALQKAEMVYLETEHIFIHDTEKQWLEKDFQELIHALDLSDKILLLALSHTHLLLPNQTDTDLFLHQCLKKLLAHPKCRFIVFTQNQNIDSHKNPIFHPSFSCLIMPEPTEMDITAILKQQRTELENFHRVHISDELLPLTYALAERYLSTTDTLEKTLLLLDSSAARASMTESQEQLVSNQPILTLSIITQVLSHWTHIPATHLQLNKFKLNEFIQCVEQRIFGQEAALQLLGNSLQKAQARLQHHSGSFCNLLFVGASHTGKRTMAIALAEQLFKHPKMLYSMSFTPQQKSLLESKLQRHTDKQYFSLRELIHQTPYAILLLEKIDQAGKNILDQLHDIFNTGLLSDEEGHIYNFKQTIIILTTTQGSTSLAKLAKALRSLDETRPVDLMQLIMREQKRDHTIPAAHYSPQDILNEITPEIKTHLSPNFCEPLHIIPFLPLNKTAVAQVIHVKLKWLGKILDSRYGIELGYAQEVIRYLTDQVTLNQNHSPDIEDGLKQLYSVIEQAILNQAENKNRTRQLFLQLNETGHLLRCEWIQMATVLGQ